MHTRRCLPGVFLRMIVPSPGRFSGYFIKSTEKNKYEK